MAVYQLTATVWQEGAQYVSRCPELGVASCGDTPDEALNELQEAVELYLENAKELGLLCETVDQRPATGRSGADHHPPRRPSAPCSRCRWRTNRRERRHSRSQSSQA